MQFINEIQFLNSFVKNCVFLHQTVAKIRSVWRGISVQRHPRSEQGGRCNSDPCILLVNIIQNMISCSKRILQPIIITEK